PSRNQRRFHRSPYLPVLPIAGVAVATNAYLVCLLSCNAAADGFDRRLGTLGGTHAAQRDLLGQFARQDDLGRQSASRNHAGLLQRQQIDLVDRQLLDFRQAHFDVATGGQRNETALRQTTGQRHLTAFETDLVETTGTGLLTLVAATGSLAQAAADTATDTLLGVSGACGRLDCVQFHVLTLYLHQVCDLVDHAAHGRRIDQLGAAIQAAQTQTAHGRAVVLLGTDQALDERDLD